MSDQEQGPTSSSSLDSLRQAGCKVVNQYLPGHNPKCDEAEVFGITKAQFERAIDLEVIRRGFSDLTSEYIGLHQELERLRGEIAKVGVHISNACYGRKASDEPPSLTNRLDMVRTLYNVLK